MCCLSPQLISCLFILLSSCLCFRWCLSCWKKVYFWRQTKEIQSPTDRYTIILNNSKNRVHCVIDHCSIINHNLRPLKLHTGTYVFKTIYAIYPIYFFICRHKLPHPFWWNRFQIKLLIFDEVNWISFFIFSLELSRKLCPSLFWWPRC